MILFQIDEHYRSCNRLSFKIWIRSLFMRVPIHIVDFEGSFNSGVLEWGVVTVLGSEIVSAQTRLCGTEIAIEPSEIAQHGLHSKLLETCAPFEADFEVFAGWRETGPLCAHNASVEDRFLKQTWPYARQVPDFSLHTAVTVATWGPWLDTLQIYRRLYPDLKSYQLQALVHTFDLENELARWAKHYCPKTRMQYHSALFDALATALLLQRLFSEKDFPECSLFQLFTLSAGSTSVLNNRQQQELF
ncbi:MAG: 3'-5' exonuclease [Puniceicoccaceae bacterium]|nr:MAG: 3'-5' exonuclease [Puniceicoccaceae bacterium]